MGDKVAAIVEQLSQQNPFNGADNLPEPPRPSEAAIPRDRPSLEQIPFIQQQISILTYNHLPRTFFSLEKHRSLQSILLTAKEALAEALPIRCLEATFVALHYTQSLRDVDRIPLSFKSEANGNTYRHIVLVLRTRSSPSLYGALGLSRKSTLMYKPMTFRSLFDVIMDYKHEYEVLGHELADIKLGIAITHDEHSKLDPCWRFIALKLSRYCEGASADGEEAHAAPTTHKFASPGSPSSRKAKTQGGEAFFRTPNADGTAATSLPSQPPPLSLETSTTAGGGPVAAATAAAPRELRSPLTRGDGPLERSGHHHAMGDAPNNSSGNSVGGGSMPPPPPPPRRPLSLAGSSSLLSPTTPVTAASTNSGVSGSRPGAESYAPLARLLSNYTRLLPTICEQYYKTIAAVDPTNRPLKLCYMDLDTAERDAGVENQRRLQHIAELQSPLSPEARRVAATRQLRPAKKERANSRQPAGSAAGAAGNGASTNSTSEVSGGTKRRQASSTEGRPAKRRSPASPGLASSDARRGAAGGGAAASSASTGAAGSSNAAAAHRHRSPRTRLTPITPGASPVAATRSTGAVGGLPPSPLPTFAPATVAPPSLAAALAASSHSMRNPLTFEGTLVDAHSICSSTSAEQTATEGYVTPRDGRYRAEATAAGAEEEEEVESVAPPLTPRNYDARKPTTPYDAFLRTPSSTSDLFSSPTTPNNTMMAHLALSP